MVYGEVWIGRLIGCGQAWTGRYTVRGQGCVDRRGQARTGVDGVAWTGADRRGQGGQYGQDFISVSNLPFLIHAATYRTRMGWLTVPKWLVTDPPVTEAGGR